jgi:PAT family beta-lactamase induction signal transducer AmpG
MTNSITGSGWQGLWSLYADRRQCVILLMGFSSGLPFLLGFSTLSYWFSKEGVALSTIGGLIAVSAPYSFKFLWAPIFDHVRPPIFGARLGRRRGWLVLIQLGLICLIFGLGNGDPRESLQYVAIMAFAMSFMSASQDIIVDAYRIEILAEREQGAGAASTQVGYRLGLMVSGGGAIALSAFLSWFWIYALMAGCILVGMLAAFLGNEPDIAELPESQKETQEFQSFKEHIYRMVWVPFSDLLSRPGIIPILLFILLFKYGDAIAGSMVLPFFHQLGFSALEIASVTKIFGVIATLFGVVTGGLIVAWIGIWPALLLGGCFQAITNIFFAILSEFGPDLGLLSLAIGFDSFAGGMGSGAFVAYLSALCNRSFTATQFSLLTSIMALGRTLLSVSSGFVADSLGWFWFFILTTGLALPGLFLLLYLRRQSISEGVVKGY